MPAALQSRPAAPKAKRELTRVTDMTGGLDRRVSPSLMKPERARRLKNATLSTAGEWGPRPGWADWHTTSLGAGRAQGAARVYLSGVTPFNLFAWGGDVYRPTDAGVIGAVVESTLHATNAVFFPHDAELVAVFDASNVPRKSLDGTTWTQMGITPPAAPTLAGLAGGSLVDTNIYSVTSEYRSALTTSNSSAAATHTVAAADLSIRVTLVASADPQVTAIDVYIKNDTAGETVRRYAGTRANTNGVVDITAPVSSTAAEAHTNRNVPPALAFGVPWKNRWWAVDAVDPTLLRFTEIFENQSWPTLYYIQIPFTRGDEITCVVPLGDVLVVFGRAKQAFLIIGQTSLDFEVKPSAAIEAGAFGPRAADVVEQGIVHAGPEGVYIFDGATDRLLSYDFEDDWRAFVNATTEANLEKVPVIYHRNRKEVRVAIPSLPMTGSAGEWALDLARTRIKDIPAWATTDRAIGGYVQWDGAESTTGNSGRLFSWSDTIGRMYEEATGTTANGSDTVADYEGPSFPVDDLKVARFPAAFVEFAPNEGLLALEVKCDGRTVLETTVDIGAGLDVYGEGEYGTAVYGGPGRIRVPVDLPVTAEGGTIQFIFQYTGQAAYRQFGYGFVSHTEPEIRGI